MDQQDETNEIIEAEEIEDGAIPNETDGATALLSLEELIKNHIENIDKLRTDLKAQKEMYEDSFNNNPTYREHTQRVKEVNKARLSVRQQIAKQPSVATLGQ